MNHTAMNTTLRAGWFPVIAMIFAVTGLTAQTSISEDLSRADKQFDLYAYNLALRTYDQVLKQQPANTHALARTGDCYFQLNRPQEAISWYDRAAVRNDVEPGVLLRYGKALMQTGDYIGAKKWFVLYSSGNSTVGQHYAQMCDFALLAAKKDGLFQALDEPLNTEASDYGPAFYGNKIVYNSARSDIQRKNAAKTSTDWTGSAYNQIFVTQRNPGDNYLQNPAFLKGDLQQNFNEGPVSFSADGRRVAFCRNNFIDGTRQIAEKGVNMSLYIADVIDGNWTNERAFPYNGSNYATGFPSLSPDGNLLYFASNQEGGMGGWDIYVSYWNGNSWSTPRNPGAPLNTPGNEVTPFFDGTNLYFSSDWHNGLGGMDVFRADIQDNTFRNIIHLGTGVNSSRDDYGFIFDPRTNIGYLTSNRQGGRGNEDIWQMRKRVDEFVISVTDAQQNPISAADIDFSACNAGIKQTDNYGQYSFAVATGKADCRVTVRKTGYRAVELPVSSAGEKNLNAILIPDYSTSPGAASTTPVSTYNPPASVYTPPAASSAYAPVTTNNGMLPDLESNTTPLTYSTTTYPVQSGTLDQYTVYVLDNQGRALPSAELNLATCGLGSVYTDASGKGAFYFPRGTSCNMVVRKAGLEDVSVPINAKTPKEMSVAMSSDMRTKFSGLVMDASTRKPIQNAIVTARSRTGSHETLASSNASGQYSLMLRAFQTYDITYSTPGYLNFVSTLQTERAVQGDMQLSPVMLERVAGGVSIAAPVTYSSVTPTSGGMISLADLEATRTTSPVSSTPLQTSPALAPAKVSGYAVQLSANPDRFSDSDIRKYDKFVQYGNLYSVKESKLYKLRLGVYKTREEANDVQKEIANSLKDAFVVWETQADENMVVNTQPSTVSPAQYSTSIAAKGLTAIPATQPALPDASVIRFAVQVAALSADKPVLLSNFTNLQSLGNVYIQPENDRMRVRVGTWDTYNQAESAQANAVRLGYRDAIVVTEKVSSTPNNALGAAAAAPQTLSTAPVTYSTTSVAAPATTPVSKAKYYIRVCALTDTQNFDVRKLDGSGAIVEKWPIGDTKMTAIMLTGLPSVEQAMSVTNRLRSSGFQDAYIIQDENGRMSKYRY